MEDLRGLPGPRLLGAVDDDAPLSLPPDFRWEDWYADIFPELEALGLRGRFLPLVEVVDDG